MDKKNRAMSFCCIALLIIILGMGLYMFYDKVSSSSQDKSTSLKECDPCVCSKEPEEIKKVDPNQCLNADEHAKYRIDEYIYHDTGLAMKVNSDLQSVSLKINWHKLGGYICPNYNDVLGGREYQIIGFTKNIKKVFFGEVGQSIHGLVLIYLMEDGTVEYSNIFKGYDEDLSDCPYSEVISEKDEEGNIYFKSMGQIANVSEVVDIYNADVSYITGGARTVIATKKDGSFYDLGKMLDK